MFKLKEKQSLEAIFHAEAMPHVDALYGAAMRYTKSPRDAEDLVQDTLLKAYTHFDKYQPGTNCKAWLFKILTNTFINRYRKQKRNRVFLVDDEEQRPLEERAVATKTDERQPREESPDEAIQRLFGDEVSAALQHVPTDFRMAVVLVDVYDFSYKEAAEILDCPIGTVMSRLYRGRRLLRAELAEYAVDSGAVREIRDGYQEQILADRNKTVSIGEERRRRSVG